jgi:prevent-host-death family protein
LTKWQLITDIAGMYVSATQARSQFLELVALAEAGETVVITRYGKPVAELVRHKEKTAGIERPEGYHAAR